MAERDGPGWRLSGTKKWISNALDADFYVVFARTTSGAGARGLTAFVVEGDAAGLSGEPLVDHLAPCDRDARADGVKVLDKARPREVDGGFKVAMARSTSSARASAPARSGWRRRRSTRRSRTPTGGTRLGGRYASSRRCPTGSRRWPHASRRPGRSSWRAAAAYDAGEPGAPKLSAMAKLFATETAQFVVDTAVQIHGAAALEQGICSKGSNATSARSGSTRVTSEIQREIVARRALSRLTALPRRVALLAKRVVELVVVAVA